MVRCLKNFRCPKLYLWPVPEKGQISFMFFQKFKSLIMMTKAGMNQKKNFRFQFPALNVSFHQGWALSQKKTCDSLNILKEYWSIKVWQWLNKKYEPSERAGKKFFLKTSRTEMAISDLLKVSQKTKKNCDTWRYY